jgi:hypothetical protein
VPSGAAVLAMGAGLPAGLRVQYPRPVLAGAGPDECVQLGRRGGAADPHQLPGEVHRGRLPALPHDLGSRVSSPQTSYHHANPQSTKCFNHNELLNHCKFLIHLVIVQGCVQSLGVLLGASHGKTLSLALYNFSTQLCYFIVSNKMKLLLCGLGVSTLQLPTQFYMAIVSCSTLRLLLIKSLLLLAEC